MSRAYSWRDEQATAEAEQRAFLDAQVELGVLTAPDGKLPPEVMMAAVQGVPTLLHLGRMADTLENSELVSLEGLSAAEAYTVGVAFGNMGSSVMKMGPGAGLKLAIVIQRMLRLLEGSPDLICKGVCRHWCAGDEDPDAPGATQGNTANA